ncbi:MAG: response regulator transcription factor [Gemmatimonadota bacterium]|nr:response regulator transcription factor [Gemmatimonadota bacterium]
MRFLLVEDDTALATSLARGLREQAYAVDVAPDGEDALYQASISPYDAIILDVNLPKIDGLTVCRTLRTQGSAVRILMLTARGRMEDRVQGLDSGADDYLPKPFEFEELLARLRALLRRRGERVDAAHYKLDDLEIDFPSQQVRRADASVELTTKEFTMLAYLARNAGRVIGRAELTEHVWDDNHDPSTNAVEVYINRLRKKIDRPGSKPLIHTRRGSGYYLAVTASSAGDG